MNESFFQIKGAIPDVAPDVIFTLFGWPISNSALAIFLILISVALFSFLVVRKFKLIPTGKLQHAVEMFYEGMVSLIVQIAGTRKKAEDILPIIASLFVFVGLANLFSFIPGISSVTFGGTPVFRTPTSDFNTTFSMALAMIVFIQFAAIRRSGLFQYFGRFFQFKKVFLGFKKSVGEGFLALIEFFVGLLDIISELAKILSLSLRLFGNIYAGEVLLVVMFAGLAFLLPSVWMSLSLFFGLIQAVVFGALAAAYYASAIEEDEPVAE
ncbi:MAG: FoF1 ATP synthase subunit a [Candidatus Harrisonbacteria bacterium]|nr:FoF1 ATP synthase subunit a [Candidatus Harrisonbacteria bacterium]